ncbi:hypothetical protein ADV92_10385 [Limosilactobacillus reuteri]|uniref:hypothetical protein n=1 Tax=Limosilactobacillus reuteri TaxID=1598 RepID=UPI0007A93F7F|nr:hypothetical protein [Limosilactobacillus reuteri]AMY14901.1 hypothetical protein ADV92_10385 [Limosilactobacillus reuteri]
MPRGAVTKARNLQLYIEGPVKEWIDIQNSLGSSIGQSIVFITALYGEVDLPSTLPKIRANQQVKFNNSSNLKNEQKSNNIQNEKFETKTKTIRIPDYSEVNAWFEVQTAPSESVNQLIFLIIGMFGITDFPSALSFSQGEIISALEQSFFNNPKELNKQDGFQTKEANGQKRQESQMNADLSDPSNIDLSMISTDLDDK